jgi:PPP family 3-phenylpropionic acid transporter
MTPSLRLSFFYAAVFFVIGVQLPFWPVFLTARGLDAREVGLILAGALWIKAFANPIAGLLADRSGDRSGLMLRLAFVGLGAACLFVPASGFWPLLVATLVMSAGFSALMPLGDNLTLAATVD